MTLVFRRNRNSGFMFSLIAMVLRQFFKTFIELSSLHRFFRSSFQYVDNVIDCKHSILLRIFKSQFHQFKRGSIANAMHSSAFPAMIRVD